MFKLKRNKIDPQKIAIIDTNTTLFDFIKPLDNTPFSKMSGIEIQELLYHLDNYYLTLRDTLGFDDNITFGLELECEHANRDKISSQIQKINLENNGQVGTDSSLQEGAEIRSQILTDTKKTWEELNQICLILDKYAQIDKNCGGHIHVGAQVLGNKPESYLNFIKLWSVYENIIFRFAYGEFLAARSAIGRYAKPIAKDYWAIYQSLKNQDDLTIQNIMWSIGHQRYCAVNLSNIKNHTEIQDGNTIEFRCPNGTLNPVVWQNNINLFVNLLLYSKSPDYNDDIVSQRQSKNDDKYQNLSWYGELFIDQALELSDILFSTNQDKAYFLRQYFKSFETSRSLDKAKTFTKKAG